jgi:hypothetical protein
MNDDAASMDEIRAILARVGLDIDDASPEELRELFRALLEAEPDPSPPTVRAAPHARFQARQQRTRRARSHRSERPR